MTHDDPEAARSPKHAAPNEARRRGFTLWLTGLPCSGKSTLSNHVAPLLREHGHDVEVLDGDVVRRDLCKGLGFSREDRDTNVLRIGFVADLLTRHGVTVIVAAVSPYAAVRDQVRQRIGRFVEVYVECPLEECERRDVKGMYQKARAGLIPAFTGVDDPYEPPTAPEVTVRTREEGVAESARAIFAKLRELGYTD
jgi:adenylylsulfate kinase